MMKCAGVARFLQGGGGLFVSNQSVSITSICNVFYGKGYSSSIILYSYCYPDSLSRLADVRKDAFI